MVPQFREIATDRLTGQCITPTHRATSITVWTVACIVPEPVGHKREQIVPVHCPSGEIKLSAFRRYRQTKTINSVGALDKSRTVLSA